jgi:hypothetical protein
MHQSQVPVVPDIPPGRRVRHGTGGLFVRDTCAEPDSLISRPNTAPAYYQGRPASLLINIMKPRRGRRQAASLTGAAAMRSGMGHGEPS